MKRALRLCVPARLITTLDSLPSIHACRLKSLKWQTCSDTSASAPSSRSGRACSSPRYAFRTALHVEGAQMRSHVWGAWWLQARVQGAAGGGVRALACSS